MKPRGVVGMSMAALVVLAASVYLYLENDWPLLYLHALGMCSGQQACTVDLSRVYSGTWQRAVAFEAGVEREAEEAVVGWPLRAYCEASQGLAFTGSTGDVVAESCSGMHPELTYLQLRPKLRLEFSSGARSWSVSRESPWVCIRRGNSNGHEYFGVTAGQCPQPAT